MIVITSKHLPVPTIPHSQGDCGPHTLYCSSLSSAESICSSAASKLRPSPSAVTLRLFVGDLAHTQGSSPLERREDGWRGLGRAKAPFRASASIWRNCRPKRSATTIRRNCDVVSNGSLAQTSNYFTLRAPQCGVRVAALVTAPCSGPAGQHGPRPPTVVHCQSGFAYVVPQLTLTTPVLSGGHALRIPRRKAGAGAAPPASRTYGSTGKKRGDTASLHHEQPPV